MYIASQPKGEIKQKSPPPKRVYANKTIDFALYAPSVRKKLEQFPPPPKKKYPLANVLVP